MNSVFLLAILAVHGSGLLSVDNLLLRQRQAVHE